MIIRKYNPTKDFEALMKVIISEGEDWSCYSSVASQEKYAKALENSITYLAFDDGKLCGYSRSFDDNGYCIHVCDLLVQRDHRGKAIGRQLMEILIEAYPDHDIYVMSDVDPYYEKLGYPKKGSIFQVIK
ncbi:MAG: GNAT family N-acetyltransferase [Candidatus Marinimicrobia bacterium]|nr:GNAT family N-acetyltransferase [Candidatus Neomarinimicrobiota bacterium]